MAASLHEAFEAGRVHAVTDWTKMASFFEGLAAESVARAASQSAPHGDARPLASSSTITISHAVCQKKKRPQAPFPAALRNRGGVSRDHTSY
jgi:hypothetical protein